MSKRLYFLANGSLETVSSGRFRGDDDVKPKIITKHIIASSTGDTSAHAPVHIDPDNPEGPLVIRYDGAGGQDGVSIRRQDDPDGAPDRFEIDQYGKTNILELDATEVSGKGFDTGDWVHNYGEDIPTDNTAVTRDASLGTVAVANLRVTIRTDPSKRYLADGTQHNEGFFLGDSLPRGLWFSQGSCSDILRLERPESNAVLGGAVHMQGPAGVGQRLYRVGYDRNTYNYIDGLPAEHALYQHFEEDGLFMSSTYPPEDETYRQAIFELRVPRSDSTLPDVYWIRLSRAFSGQDD